MAVIKGTSYSDNLLGTSGPDLIYGYEGDDTLLGGSGNDSMYGGAGDDTFLFNGSAGKDYFDGGDGVDTIGIANVSHIFNSVEVGIGSLTSVEAIVSDGSKPVYLKTEGVLDLTGIQMANINGFRGSVGNDYMTAEVVYNTSSGTTTGMTMWGYAGNDEMKGSVLNDIIDGGEGDDTLIGYAGADTLLGGDGADVLAGGVGNDTLTGGSGADWFWFETSGGVDTITDYVDGADKLIVGSSLSNINLYNYQSTSTLIEFNGGAAYAILQGVAASSIDGTDFLWA